MPRPLDPTRAIPSESGAAHRAWPTMTSALLLCTQPAERISPHHHRSIIARRRALPTTEKAARHAGRPLPRKLAHARPGHTSRADSLRPEPLALMLAW